MGLAITWIVFAILIGALAGSKGRSGFGYFLLSLALSPIIGLLVLLIAGENKPGLDGQAIVDGTAKKCPACAEVVKREALKCRFCQHEFGPPEPLASPFDGA